MIKILAAALLLTAAASPVFADEPDGLKLPFGFHAQVVNDGVGAGARHLAIHGDDLYVSTRAERNATTQPGVIALHLDRDHKAAEPQHFSSVNDGTGIRFYKGALYVASPSTVYRFTFKKHELVPTAQPEVIVDGLPAKGHDNVGMAFDNRGHMLLAVSGEGNICTDPSVPKGQPPKGLDPCPSLSGRAGVWEFSAEKQGQKFPADGEQFATGVRDMMAVDWSPDMHAMYGVMQGRNGTAQMFGKDVSEEDDRDSIAEEMHRIDKGANLGWPFTYYDISQHQRVLAPEYGGDGKTPAKDGNIRRPWWRSRRINRRWICSSMTASNSPRNTGAARLSYSRAVRAACCLWAITAMTWCSCPLTKRASPAKRRSLPMVSPVPPPPTAIPARPSTGPAAPPSVPTVRFMWWMRSRAVSGASIIPASNPV